METHQNNGIEYHLDDTATRLAREYPPSRIIYGPHLLVGEFTKECGLWPFLMAAFHTGHYFGFTFSDYDQVVSCLNPVEPIYMAVARSRVQSETDLEILAQEGHLRKVVHEKRAVYFPSEELIKRATR